MPKKVYERNQNYHFRQNVRAGIDLLCERGSLKRSSVIASMADHVRVDPNVIKNWFYNEDRHALPDVEQGYDIANFLRTNVQKLITGEDPANIYTNKVIREIVDILDGYSEKYELLIEIRGIISFHLDKYAEKESQMVEDHARETT